MKLVVFTSPGRVSVQQHSTADLKGSGTNGCINLLVSEEDIQQDGREAVEASSRTNYCTVCVQARPTRAHHCSWCKCCVRVYDHHCQFVNNCIGYYNRGHFIQFLGWVVVGSAWIVATGGMWFVPLAKRSSCLTETHHTQAVASDMICPPPLSLVILALVGLVLLGGAVTCALVGFLLVLQIPLVCRNATVHDWLYNEQWWDQYNRGVATNLEMVFGSPLWLLWLPRKLKLDSFEVHHGSHLELDHLE